MEEKLKGTKMRWGVGKLPAAAAAVCIAAQRAAAFERFTSEKKGLERQLNRSEFEEAGEEALSKQIDGMTDRQDHPWLLRRVGRKGVAWLYFSANENDGWGGRTGREICPKVSRDSKVEKELLRTRHRYTNKAKEQYW